MKKLFIFAAAVFCLAALFCCNHKAESELEYLPEKIQAKGTLVIEGGGDRIAPILNKIIEKGGGVDRCKLLIVPFASGYAEETGVNQVEEFKALGCKDVDYILCSKDSIDSPESLAKLNGVTAVFFSGGDQNRLYSYLAGTKFFDKIKQIYRDGGVVSGTSAGAAIMSRIMLTGNSLDTTRKSGYFNYIKAGDVETVEGFGFLDNIIVDQHFIARRRQVRLINVLLDHPGYRGIGIDEEAAIVVNPDNTMEIVGDNCAMFFEPYRPEDGKPNHSFKLTILYPGDKINL